MGTAVCSTAIITELNMLKQPQIVRQIMEQAELNQKHFIKWIAHHAHDIHVTGHRLAKNNNGFQKIRDTVGNVNQPLFESGPIENVFQFIQNGRRIRQRECAIAPTGHNLCRRTTWRDETTDDDAGIKDYSHHLIRPVVGAIPECSGR